MKIKKLNPWRYPLLSIVGVISWWFGIVFFIGNITEITNKDELKLENKQLKQELLEAKYFRDSLQVEYYKLKYENRTSNIK